MTLIAESQLIMSQSQGACASVGISTSAFLVKNQFLVSSTTPNSMKLIFKNFSNSWCLFSMHVL